MYDENAKYLRYDFYDFFPDRGSRGCENIMIDPLPVCSHASVPSVVFLSQINVTS